MSPPGPAAATPGWYDDPWHVAELRWWSGITWTGDVGWREKPPRPPHPTLPLVVAVGALAMTLTSLVLSRFVLEVLVELQWPIAVYVVISGLIGYGPVLWWARWASRRWGTGSVRVDTGLFVRWRDAGWGPVTWMACLGVQLLLGALIVVTGIPFTGNTEGIDDLSADRGYVITLLVLAVVAAPTIEEIVFRGLVMRGLLSRMHVVAAVAVQAVLFGFAHFDPVRGTGNIGLALVLSGVGAVLGGAEYLLRRIGPTIVAHAILNGVAMTIVLSGWSPAS